MPHFCACARVRRAELALPRRSLYILVGPARCELRSEPCTHAFDLESRSWRDAAIVPILDACVLITCYTCRYEWAHSVRLDELGDDEEGDDVQRIQRRGEGGGIAVGGGEGAARRGGSEGGSEPGGSSEAIAAHSTLRGHRVSMVFRDRPAG